MFNFQSWSEEFLQKANEPMSKELTGVFLKVFQMEESNVSMPEAQDQFMYKLIDQRAKFIGLDMTEASKVFLMLLAQSPGSAVMYLYAMRSKATYVDMKILTELFPVGFLSSIDMEIMWDKQKGYNCEEQFDNCLDNCIFKPAHTA